MEMAPPKRPPKQLGPLTAAAFRDHLRFSGGKRVVDFFRELDADGSGELTKKEFAKHIKALGFTAATLEEINEVWSWIDKSGDGAVPFAELDKKLRERPVEEPPAPAPEVAVPLSPKKGTQAAPQVKGHERFVQPTLAAHGFPLQVDPDSAHMPARSAQKRALPKALTGDEHFIQPTMSVGFGYNFNTGLEANGPVSPPSAPHLVSPHHSYRCSSPRQPTLGDPEWAPTQVDSDIKRMVDVPAEPPLPTRAVRDTETFAEIDKKRKAAARIKREMVRRAAQRAAQRAETKPIIMMNHLGSEKYETSAHAQKEAQEEALRLDMERIYQEAAREEMRRMRQEYSARSRRRTPRSSKQPSARTAAILFERRSNESKKEERRASWLAAFERCWIPSTQPCKSYSGATNSTLSLW